MRNIRPTEADFQRTRAAYGEACTLLGYSGACSEADEVIDLVGLDEIGGRGATFASFYPAKLTAAIDRAAQLGRRYPEALLSRDLLGFLEFVATRGTP